MKALNTDCSLWNHKADVETEGGADHGNRILEPATPDCCWYYGCCWLWGEGQQAKEKKEVA